MLRRKRTCSASLALTDFITQCGLNKNWAETLERLGCLNQPTAVYEKDLCIGMCAPAMSMHGSIVIGIFLRSDDAA